MLAVLAWAMMCDFVWEAPRSSVINYVASVDALLSLPNACTLNRIYLGNYGGMSMKPLKLICSGSWLKGLQGAKSRKALTKLATTVVVNGKMKITGNKKLLKQSENYPVEFGVAVAMALDVHLGQLAG